MINPLPIKTIFLLSLILFPTNSSSFTQPKPKLPRYDSTRTTPHPQTDHLTITQVSITASEVIAKPQDPPTNKLTKMQRLLAGGTPLFTAQMILYPIDALRTLAQTRDHRTLADLGLSALAKGAVTTSLFSYVIGAIQFILYGIMRQHTSSALGASIVSAVGSCAVSVPQEVIKQRLVTGLYATFGLAVNGIFNDGGIPGFYEAWKPTMARNVPFVVTAFTAKDILEKKLTGNNEKKSLSFRDNFLIGVLSAIVAVLVTNPADVIKTRMMTQAASTQIPYTSALDCARTIWMSEGGFRTFYAGVGKRLFYMGPLWAINFSVNGWLTKYFEKSNAQRRQLEQQERLN